jgi:hypothetical protein
VADDLFSLIDKLLGRSDWDVCLLPAEGRPRLLMQFGERYAPLVYELTEAAGERLRKLKAGSPRIEARGPQGIAFDLMPLDHQALGWRLHRERRRQGILDRDRVEIAVYYDPRPVFNADERAPLEEAQKTPRRRRGRPPIDDTDVIQQVQAEIRAKGLSALAATEAVADRLITAGQLGEGARAAWIERIRRKV